MKHMDRSGDRSPRTSQTEDPGSAGKHAAARTPPAYGIDLLDSAGAHAGAPGHAGVVLAQEVAAAAERAPGEAVERASRTTGDPVAGPTRRRVEQATGADLDGVRVHLGATSAAAAAALGARAYTLGQHIHFGAGQYEPGTPAGQRLLGHELIHTIQQRDGAGAPQAALAVSQPGDPAEVEADTIAAAVFADADAPPPPRRVHQVVAGGLAQREQVKTSDFDEILLLGDLCSGRKALLAKIKGQSPLELQTMTAALAKANLLAKVKKALDPEFTALLGAAPVAVKQPTLGELLTLAAEKFYADNLKAHETATAALAPEAQSKALDALRGLKPAAWEATLAVIVKQGSAKLACLQKALGPGFAALIGERLYGAMLKGHEGGVVAQDKVRADKGKQLAALSAFEQEQLATTTLLKGTHAPLTTALGADFTKTHDAATGRVLAQQLAAGDATSLLVSITKSTTRDADVKHLIAVLRTNGTLDGIVAALPQGAAMSGPLRAALQRLIVVEAVTVAEARALFLRRYKQTLADASAAWTLPPLKIVWRQLDLLPDTDVTDATINATVKAITGSGGMQNTLTIELGQSADAPKLSHTVRHEVAHAVHDKLGGVVDKWLKDEMDFFHFDGTTAGVTAWLAELGDFPATYKFPGATNKPFDSAAKAAVVAMVKSWMGSTAWESTRTDVASTPEEKAMWKAMPAEVSNAVVQSKKRWYTNYTSFQKKGARHYFLNHWYHWPSYMGAAAVAIVPQTGENYSAMSHFEFFANCYAKFFEDPAGFADHRKWGGGLPAEVQTFFRHSIIGRHPYADAATRKKNT